MFSPRQDDGNQQQQHMLYPMNVPMNGSPMLHSPITPISSPPITAPISPYQNFYQQHPQRPLQPYPSPISAPPSVSTWRDIEPGHSPLSYMHQSPSNSLASPIDSHSGPRYSANYMNPPPLAQSSQTYEHAPQGEEVNTASEPNNIPYLIHENECTTFISKLYQYVLSTLPGVLLG